MADDDGREEALTLSTSDAEMNELLGMFDLPAFVRRGQDLEYTLIVE